MGTAFSLWFVKLIFKLHDKGTLTSLSLGSVETLKFTSLALTFSQGHKHTASANSWRVLAKTSRVRQLNRKHILPYFKYFYHDNVKNTKLLQWWYIYTSTRITHRIYKPKQESKQASPMAAQAQPSIWGAYLKKGHFSTGTLLCRVYLRRVFCVPTQVLVTPARSSTASIGNRTDSLLLAEQQCCV